MKIPLTRRSLRLASGVVLFAYVTAHFVNHALGLISIAAAEQGLHIAVAVWQSPLGTLVLYGAVSVHITLAFIAIHQHRTLHLPALEWLRIGAGLSIPTLLIGHAVDTRLALEVYGHPTDYAHVVWTLWHSGRQGRQIALLVPGWVHGCLGLKFALSGRTWYPRWRLALFGAALLLPVFAVLGFFSMLKEVAVLANDPSWVTTTIGATVQHPQLIMVRDGVLTFYYCAIVAVFIARGLRTLLEERTGSLVSIGYPQRTVKVPRGWSVLDASRAHRIPHVSLCGGRARCSTCRVHVIAGADDCPAPSDEERSTLQRIRASSGTRLACQLRPTGSVSVVPLVAPASRPKQGSIFNTVDRDLVVVLVDVRWEQGQRGLLPHDMLHVLEAFSELVRRTMQAAGGTSTQFVGDRVVVLFGLDSAADQASRRALGATAQLDVRLQELRLQQQREFGCDMQYVIYAHFGSAVVGEVGERFARTLTATGSAVDVVRQLATKEYFSASPNQDSETRRIVVSQSLFAQLKADVSGIQWYHLELLRAEQIEVTRLKSVDLAALIGLH